MASKDSTLTFIDHIDISTAKVQQLQALIHAITAEGFSNFSSMNEDLQHNYLWTVANLVDELKDSVCWLAVNREWKVISNA